MALTRRKLLLSFLAAALLAALAFAIITGNPPRQSTPLPNPNGYDDFIRAGSLMQNGDFGAYPTMDHDTLASLVASNNEALAVARLGLSRKCSAPTDSIVTNNIATGDMIALKRLAQLFAAEGRLAEIENRFADAAQSYTDAVRLGNESSRGGVLINRLVGVACEAIGLMNLAKLLPKLDCDQSHKIISDLQNIDSHGVEWDEIWKNEKRFARHEIRKYRNPIRLISALWDARKIKGPSQARHNKSVAHLRLITVELALRCYTTEHGRPPSSLNDLVPKYLASVPADPFGAGPLSYQPNATNWLLYSLGVAKRDDGGQMFGNSAKGNLRYDSRW